MINFTTLPPLSLYIHYPWCARKCPYCDFNSHTIPSSFSNDKQRDMQYVDTLIKDLEQELPSIWGRSVQSIFIGGGTPSLIQPEVLQQLISQLTALVKLSPMAEITLEANPGTVDQVKFNEFYSAGINRLSIGVQSFNDRLLENIGRIHTSQQAYQAIECAQFAGFDNINLDLMYALPGQTLGEAIYDVQQAIDSQSNHLSHYQLTLEPNTLFAIHPPQLPDDDLSYEMQVQCQQLFAESGFMQYEVSAFAKSGNQCQHNLNYWQFGDYLGIGAGAHGKISDAAQQTITRRWKEKHPSTYMAKIMGGKPLSVGQNINETSSNFVGNSTNDINSFKMAGEKHLSNHDISFEFMLNSSRLVNGFPTRLFAEHTGLAINHIENGLKKAVELDLIEWHLHHIKPTERGLRYLNELQAIFL